MKPYVGIAKARPDSRTPRRFTTVSSTTKPSDSATACGASAGNAEVTPRPRPRPTRRRSGRSRRAARWPRPGRPPAEVGPADGVRAAAVRIGVAGLPVRRDDDDQQRDDARAPARASGAAAQAAEAEDEQDLLGRVGDRATAGRSRRRAARAAWAAGSRPAARCAAVGRRRTASGCAARSSPGSGVPPCARAGCAGGVLDASLTRALGDLHALLTPGRDLHTGHHQPPDVGHCADLGGGMALPSGHWIRDASDHVEHRHGVAGPAGRGVLPADEPARERDPGRLFRRPFSSRAPTTWPWP